MVTKNSIRELTKQIVLGVTVSGAPMLTVGCAPPPPVAPALSTPMLPEKQQIAQLLATRDPQAIDAFLAAHPDSRYNVHLLNSLSPSILMQLSSASVAGLPPQVIRHLTRRSRAALARIPEQSAGHTAPISPNYTSPSIFGAPGGGQSNGNTGRGNY